MASGSGITSILRLTVTVVSQSHTFKCFHFHTTRAFHEQYKAAPESIKLPRSGQKTFTIPDWVWKLIMTLQELVRGIELWMETLEREIYVVSGLEHLEIKEKVVDHIA